MSRTRRINRVSAKRAETPTQDSTPADHPETPKQPAETPAATPEEVVLIPMSDVASSSGRGVTPSGPDSDVNVEYEKKKAAKPQEAVDDPHSKTNDPGG